MFTGEATQIRNRIVLYSSPITESKFRNVTFCPVTSPYSSPLDLIHELSFSLPSPPLSLSLSYLLSFSSSLSLLSLSISLLSPLFFVFSLSFLSLYLSLSLSSLFFYLPFLFSSLFPLSIHSVHSFAQTFSSFTSSASPQSPFDPPSAPLPQLLLLSTLFPTPFPQPSSLISFRLTSHVDNPINLDLMDTTIASIRLK